MSRLADLHPRRFFIETWREIALRSREERLRADGVDLRPVIIYSVAIVSLILQEYLGNQTVFFSLLHRLVLGGGPAGLGRWLADAAGSIIVSDRYQLWALAYWVAWRVFGFVVMPLVTIAFTPGLRLLDCGLRFRGLREHIWIYGVLFAIVLPVVFAVSFTRDFATYYPFYKNAHRSLVDFALWEGLYIAQFIALEFFFRGFMLQPLERSMGPYAIFVMVAPYVMIHFGKPMPECFGAILAGIVLGTLAMRTRSIWLGAFIHITVALSMDLAAIWQVNWR